MQAGVTLVIISKSPELEWQLEHADYPRVYPAFVIVRSSQIVG